MNAFGSISGSGSAQPTAGYSSLADAIEQFDPIIQKMEQHRAQIEQMLARLVGPHPSEVSGKADQAPPPGRIANINVRARIMMQILESTEALLRQLDQAL